MSLKAQDNLEFQWVFTMFWSCLKIWVQTRREKKRNAIHFSREGLQDPQSDRASKKRREGDGSGDIEPKLSKIHARQPIEENELPQPILVNEQFLDYESVSLGSFLEQIHSNELGTNDEPVAAEPCEEVSNKDRGKSMQQDIRSDTTASSIHDGGDSSKSVDGLDKSSRVDSSRTIDLPGSLHRPLMASIAVHVSSQMRLKKKERSSVIHDGAGDNGSCE